MDEQTKKEIYEIIEQSIVLEGLMKELECPLSEKQKNNLSAEEFFIDSTLCIAGCICDIVSRIDNALHHPEEYPEPEPTPPYDGNAESVYNRLCVIRDDWKNLYYSDTIDKRKKQFLVANHYFSSWTSEVFKYTEHLGNKYGLLPLTVRIGGASMVDLGIYNDANGSISYNRRLIRDPEYAMITIIHELCHVRYPNHSREFWQLYEDVCISEGVLLERALGDRKSLREQVKDDCCLNDSWISNNHIVHSLGKSLVTTEQFIHYLSGHPVLEKSFLEPDISHSYDIPHHESSVFTSGTNASLYSSG